MAVSDCSRQCRRCGNEFKRTAKGQPTKYCSTWCRDGGKPKLVRKPKESKECAGCGTVFLGHAHRKYCSLQCKANHVVAMSGRQPFHCEHCGKQTDRKRQVKDARRFCGRSCFFTHRLETGRVVSAERQALHQIASNWRWKPSPLVVTEVAALRRIARYVEKPRLKLRQCPCCAAPVVSVHDQGKLCRACVRVKNRQLPSYKSAKRAYRSARRAVERGAEAEMIDPIAVCKRDGWRCYLCGVDTPERLRGTYSPRAPEIDHVLALANGGTHTWSNVRCACRACNSAKGAQMLEEMAA